MPRGRARRRGAGRAAAGGNQRNQRQGNDDNRPNTRGRKRNADECNLDGRPPADEHVAPEGQMANAGDIDDGGNRLLQDHSDVWVLGDSIPYWAGHRAQATGKPKLKVEGSTIAWWGVRGLRWTEFRHSIESQVLLSSPPSIIILHLGGNDLVVSSVIKLKRIIKAEVSYLRDAFPETLFVWVDILPRRVWRGALEHKAIEQKRIRVNRLGRNIVHASGRSESVSPDIDEQTNFFLRDGVHLNDVGLEFYLDYLKEAITKNMALAR